MKKTLNELVSREEPAIVLIREWVSTSENQSFNFCPFLRIKEGSACGSDRRPVPVEEAFDMKVDIVRQLQQG